MSINAVQSSNYFSKLNTTGGVNSPNAAGKGDGDGDGSGSGAGGIGGFASVIAQALSQIGVTAPSGSLSSNISRPSSPTSGSSSTTGPASPANVNAQQALGSFLQSLFAALEAQGQASTPSVNGAGIASGVTGVHGGHGHHHHGGGGASQIQAELQSLIQQLTAASGTSGTSGVSGTTGSPGASNALGAADTTLQQNFQNLLSAQGVTGSQANLTSFLQTLSQGLQNNGAAGNLVSTQV